MGARADLRRGRDHIRGTDYVVKKYRYPASADTEIAWYERLDGLNITPKLIGADRESLTIAYHPVATTMPKYRPVNELAELLLRLEERGIHFRDLHTGNIVAGPDGPLLIDFETAVYAPGKPSYDIHGPEVSGVPVPDIHLALASGYRMHWGSSHRASILNTWGAEFPSHLLKK